VETTWPRRPNIGQQTVAQNIWIAFSRFGIELSGSGVTVAANPGRRSHKQCRTRSVPVVVNTPEIGAPPSEAYVVGREEDICRLRRNLLDAARRASKERVAEMSFDTL